MSGAVSFVSRSLWRWPGAALSQTRFSEAELRMETEKVNVKTAPRCGHYQLIQKESHVGSVISNWGQGQKSQRSGGPGSHTAHKGQLTNNVFSGERVAGVGWGWGLVPVIL